MLSKIKNVFVKKNLQSGRIREYYNYSQPNTLSILANQKAVFSYTDIQTYLDYYQAIMPLANGVDKVSDTIGSIDPVIKSKTTDEVQDTAPFIDFLDNPNTNVDYCEFIKSLAKYYLIAGNVYLMLTFSSRKEVLEMFVIPPQWVSYDVGSDGYVGRYIYAPQNAQQITFDRDNVGNQLKYFSRDGRTELIHIKDFNPSTNFRVFGLSKLHAISYELEQYLAGSVYNSSMLANGARPSALFKLRADLDGTTEDQQNRISSALDNMYSGSANAGRPIISGDIDNVMQLNATNVDMDFATLKTMTIEAIYNRLQIPLALIQSTSLSMANMETAKLDLYYNGIFPVLNQLFSVMQMFVLPYFDDSPDLELTFDAFKIDAIRLRSLEELQIATSFEVMSDNEIRDRMGLPDYPEGDEIYKTTSKAAVGSSDALTQSNPADDETSDDEEGVDND